MKLIYSIFLFVAISFKIATGQVTPFQIAYGERNDDVINSIISLDIDGQLLFGTTNNFGAINSDFLLVRINDSGTPIWINRYGGNNQETAEHVELANNGGYILLGTTNSFGAGNNDIIVIKTDFDGNTEWTRTYGGSRNDIAGCIKRIPNNNGYIIAGRTESFGRGGEDGYLIRINNDGDVIWSRSYGTVYNERFYYIDNTRDGGFIITGIENASASLRYDQLVIRTDGNGSIMFNNSYGDNGGSANDASDCIKQTNDGGFAFSGHYQSFGAGGLDLALTKINGEGTIEWARVFGATGDERAYDFQIDRNNNYVISGYTTSYGNGRNEALAILLDREGRLIWSNTYGGEGNEEFYECTINNDSILFVGYTQSIGSGGQDFYAVKTDFTGTRNENCSSLQIPIRNSTANARVRQLNHSVSNLSQQTISYQANIRRIIINNSFNEVNQCPGITPVKILEFSSSKYQNECFLNWQTASELNTRIFIIEKSYDGFYFTPIDSVNANNKGEQVQYYKYKYTPTLGKSYYRIKILDYSGHEEFSKIIYDSNNNYSLEIHQNILSNFINIECYTPYLCNFHIQIVNLNGNERYNNTLSFQEKFSIDTEQWEPGIYVIKVLNINTKEYIVKKIIKH